VCDDGGPFDIICSAVRCGVALCDVIRVTELQSPPIYREHPALCDSPTHRVSSFVYFTMIWITFYELCSTVGK